ncbi:MAG: hypothetical protein OXD43_08225 [Bacteroidetes bacterium]|nr:hypothetical protein [Bacteroidota bacterium]
MSEVEQLKARISRLEYQLYRTKSMLFSVAMQCGVKTVNIKWPGGKGENLFVEAFAAVLVESEELRLRAESGTNEVEDPASK